MILGMPYALTLVETVVVRNIGIILAAGASWLSTVSNHEVILSKIMHDYKRNRKFDKR